MFETNTDTVLQLFFSNPYREFYLREIARITKIPPASVYVIMKKLEKQAIVSREKTPAIDKFRARTEDWQFTALKRAYNLRHVLESKGLRQFITYAEPKAVWMTGAYASGRNDIMDTLTICSLDSKAERFSSEIWEKELGVKVQITHITKRKITDHMILLMEGILLYGRVE